MATNIQKWNYWQSIIDEKIKEFLNAYQGERYTHFYEVVPSGMIIESTVLEIYYKRIFPYKNKDKPTNIEVIEIQEIASAPLKLHEDEILFRYETVHGLGEWKSTGAHYLKDIKNSNGRIMTNRQDAETKSLEILAKIQHENELLANGHERCDRCRKVVPVRQIVNHTITGRGRKAVFNSWKGRWEDKAVLTQDRMKFCSGTCAGNEQMSREG